MHRTQQWRERGRWGRSREWDPRHYLDHQLRPTSQELRKWTGVRVLRECGRRRGEGGVIRLVETERASLSLEPIRCGICRHDKNAENGAAVTRGRGKGALPFVILGRKGNRMVVVEVKKKKKNHLPRKLLRRIHSFRNRKWIARMSVLSGNVWRLMYSIMSIWEMTIKCLI